MARISEHEKSARRHQMSKLRNWLGQTGKNQRWLADQLGIYHGYVSNLLTGKQIPSDAVLAKAKLLMGPPPVRQIPKKRPVRRRHRFHHWRPLTYPEMRAVADIAKAYVERTQADAPLTPDELVVTLHKIRSGITLELSP